MNEIKRCSIPQAIATVLNQTVRPTDAVMMEKLLQLVSELLSSVDTFVLGCNISQEAARLSFSVMSKEVNCEN